MCKPDFASKSKAPPLLARSGSSLLSVDAFETKPSTSSMVWYSVGCLAFLFFIEYSLRYFLDEYQHFHPLLENLTNRLILARHIGTDAFCCFCCAAMGFLAWTEVCPEFIDSALGRKSISKGGYESRIFTYRPAAFRICLFFAVYQIKNLYDTIIWNDGPEFIAHHMMSLSVAYASIFHGICHTYAPFFFGVSEVSTAILCLLANFDDTHGIPGLADAWPAGKVIFGGLFAVAFIVCRIFLWSFIGYYYVTDSLLAINKTDSTRDEARPWVKVMFGSFTGLSALQVIWLGQIILVAKEEIGKM